MTTLTDVLNYIHDEPNIDEVERLVQAIKYRRDVLGRERASAVKTGEPVTLTGLSPKILNGLTGIVESVSGNRCEVVLDVASTSALRRSRSRRFYVADDRERYTVHGIPLQCCEVTT